MSQHERDEAEPSAELPGMTARIYPLGPTQQAEYPDKAFMLQQALGALKAATCNRRDDERGNEVFVVAWQGRVRQFRQLEDASRYIETLPRPTNR